jgi:dTDP-4-amino-4,6-dideoxygalactose transaminase
MRDRLIERLAAAGIESRPIWTPLHRTRLWSEAPRIGGKVAERLFELGFSLPSSSSLTDPDRARVVAALAAAATR